MRLSREFIQLPLRFDVQRLRDEVAAFDEADWRPHPEGHPGNWALPLIAAGGDPTNDTVKGPMAPTPHLGQCEYIRQVLASFQSVLGRTRLMRLDEEAEATPHVDSNYYWLQRVRIHVPVVTRPEVEFLCDEASVHMAPGECWIFDTYRRHNVLNRTGERRIHLVADTVGSAAFWELVRRAESTGNGAKPVEPDLLEHRPGEAAGLEFERSNFPVVMSPWEQRTLMDDLLGELARSADGSPDAEAIRGAVERFMRDWLDTWAQHGPGEAGWPAYRQLLDRLKGAVKPLEGTLELPNGLDAVSAVNATLVAPGLNPDLAGTAPAAGPRTQPRTVQRPQRKRRFERPIIIVAPPRSGTSMLFETLAESPSVWTVGGESHAVIEDMAELRPQTRDYESNRLTADDAQPAVARALRQRFWARVRDRDGHKPGSNAAGLRLLEKTPKNALRVPFLNAAFPDAVFVYLYRDPRESLASMIEAWESERFVTYSELPDWPGPPWSLLLVPGWRELAGAELAEIVTEQWTRTTEVLLDDLERLPPGRWCATDYRSLVDDPQTEIERICGFVGIEWDRELKAPLPLARHTVTPPDPEKWKTRRPQLKAMLPRTEELAERGRDWLAKTPDTRPRIPDPPGLTSPLRSIHTKDFSAILDRLESSLLVSTYRGDQLVCLRTRRDAVNTHFRGFDRPMGIAANGDRLALATAAEVWDFRDPPDLAPQIPPEGAHDACYVPCNRHRTGDVDIHEIAYAEGELWVVATAFSCLATIDATHSIVPRWIPSFVSGLEPDDRCHLNGLAVVDDRVRFVTALGETDTADGWRPGRATGGCLIDVESSESVLRGLSLPHSPRWHDGRLWFLESGQGSLCVADLEQGGYETVARLPGFTRGLALAGSLAFVGVSRLRKSEDASRLPLEDRLDRQSCGVWVVNLETGKVDALLRFEELVQEVFEVTLLEGVRYPEVAETDSDAANYAFVLPTA